MNIREMLDFQNKKADDIIDSLREKSITVPEWAGVLEKEYDPLKHPVMDKSRYPDRTDDVTGMITYVTRITYDLQRLAAKRLGELCFGVPVKRVYDVEGRADLQPVADLLERIYKANRIDALNMERARSFFASCEVMTLWYAVQEDNRLYGVDSKLKIRHVNYSPMLGDELYPLFDEYGDLVALSVEYKRKRGSDTVSFFDCYTADQIVKFNNDGGSWNAPEVEVNPVGKIPAVYMWRPKPAWEDASQIVYEMEWAMSRNGNYLRENSRPVFVVSADEEIDFGKEPPVDEADRSVLKYPAGSSAHYVTWQQAVDSLKFHITELRQMFFTQLQIPDWSFDNLKSTPLSGEGMRQMFIDATLKVGDESGRLVEFLDREMNVVKAFAKQIQPQWAALIDELRVETVITPCTVDNSDEDVAARSGEREDGKHVQQDEE